MILVSKEYSIAHYKRLPGLVKEWGQLATAINGHQCDYDCNHITKSAILVLLQTQKFAGGKISGFERKSFTLKNFPDSKFPF